MAPEIIAGGEADERADVYSAGVSIYEMLTGRYPYGEIEPFTHPSFNRFMAPERYNPDVPPWLSETLKKACMADPKNRYPDAVEFASALQNPQQTPLRLRKAPLLERITPEQWKKLFLYSLLINALLLLAYWW
jgi:protein phosphatase